MKKPLPVPLFGIFGLQGGPGPEAWAGSLGLGPAGAWLLLPLAAAALALWFSGRPTDHDNAWLRGGTASWRRVRRFGGRGRGWGRGRGRGRGRGWGRRDPRGRRDPETPQERAAREAKALDAAVDAYVDWDWTAVVDD